MNFLQILQIFKFKTFYVLYIVHIFNKNGDVFMGTIKKEVLMLKQ